MIFKSSFLTIFSLNTFIKGRFSYIESNPILTSVKCLISLVRCSTFTTLMNILNVKSNVYFFARGRTFTTSLPYHSDCTWFRVMASITWMYHLSVSGFRISCTKLYTDRRNFVHISMDKLGKRKTFFTESGHHGWLVWCEQTFFL